MVLTPVENKKLGVGPFHSFFTRNPDLTRILVEGHRTRIMLKVGAKCSAGIITYALSNGIYQRTLNER